MHEADLQSLEVGRHASVRATVAPALLVICKIPFFFSLRRFRNFLR
jgi:hypothetical protein